MRLRNIKYSMPPAAIDQNIHLIHNTIFTLPSLIEIPKQIFTSSSQIYLSIMKFFTATTLFYLASSSLAANTAVSTVGDVVASLQATLPQYDAALSMNVPSLNPSPWRRGSAACLHPAKAVARQDVSTKLNLLTKHRHGRRTNRQLRLRKRAYPSRIRTQRQSERHRLGH